MTAGLVQRVACCRATVVLCHRPHHLKQAGSGMRAHHAPVPPPRRAPPGPGVRRDNEALGNARLQARFTCLPDQHVRFPARSHHEGVGPLVYLVSVLGGV